MSEPMRVVFWCEGHPLDGSRRVFRKEAAEVEIFENIRGNIARRQWRDTGITDLGDRVFTRIETRRLGGGDGDT